MMIHSGIDIIEVGRIDRAILRHGQRFFDRFFTSQEIIDSRGHTPALAARFAAKEAVAKALGTGIGEIGWKEIEVRLDSRRKPELHLHGRADLLATEKALRAWSISLSHTHDHAVAIAIALQGISPHAEGINEEGK
jgi:holo-[acyl-carrier protein] synthase